MKQKYKIKWSYSYKYNEGVQQKDKYPLQVISDNEMTADQLIEAIKKELLPNKQLEVVEQKLTVDGKLTSGNEVIKTESKISFDIVQVGIGEVVDPKAPK